MTYQQELQATADRLNGTGWNDDAIIERVADRLMTMSRQQIEAEYGPMTDEEFNEVFGEA